MKKLIVLLFVSAVGFAQQISQYRYVIVPSKFDAQKAAGQFGLNSLTKAFLEKNGYTVFYDTDILPPEVSAESCNKIYTNVYSDNTFRKTRLKVEIKDCRNAVLFESPFGESAEKDNRVAYNQALRAAFRSFDKAEFRFDPANSAPVIEAVAPKPAETKSAETKIIYEEPPKIATHVSLKPVSGELSAQKTLNGFQLVHTSPKIVFKLYTTSHPEIFLAESDTKHGVVLKKDGQWFFEYRSGLQVIAEPLSIKF